VSAPVRPPPAPAVAEAAAEPPVARPNPGSRIIEGEQLPTASDLIAAGTLSSPPLNLDLHVYSGAPAGRFVIINGRKYREGAALTEGPSVETITAEGVILSSQGRRFMLSSQ
jgi:general secretion pathway protein B